MHGALRVGRICLPIQSSFTVLRIRLFLILNAKMPLFTLLRCQVFTLLQENAMLLIVFPARLLFH